MTIGIVIPVRNDQSNLNRLLVQIREMGTFDQVVVVDDASDIPVHTDTFPGGRQGGDTTVLRHPNQLGPGAARNSGLPAVHTDHVIFFDSDDLLTPEFSPLVHDLRGESFDFCNFRYQDSERGYFGGWGQSLHDEEKWKSAGALNARLKVLSGREKWTLAEAGNYPWNKIYRTSFLRENHLKCTEILVHEDIELHWNSFVAAERVLSSNRIAALHVVHPKGQRLTNLSDRNRLQVFTALHEVALQLPPFQETPMAIHAFLRFAVTLLDWAYRNLQPEFQPEFTERKRTFLAEILTSDLFHDLTKRDPVLALTLSLHLAHTFPEKKLAALC